MRIATPTRSSPVGPRASGWRPRSCSRPRGARVSLIARDAERLGSTRRPRSGRARRTASADVTDAAAVTGAIDGLVADQGPCDLLVAAAGASHPGYFEELEVEHFRAQMDLNYFGTLHPIRAVLGSMIERGRGTIVGISSAAGLVGVFGFGAYAPSKYAVRGLMDALRAEVEVGGRLRGLRVPARHADPGLRDREPHQAAGDRGGLRGDQAEAARGDRRPGLVRGIERDRHVITFDPQTALLARGGGLVAPLVYRLMAREVRKTARP